MAYSPIYTVLYPIVLLVISGSFVLGVSYIWKNSRELKRDKRDLDLVQADLSTISRYDDENMPDVEQYDSQIISRWIRVCKSRVGSGLGTTEDILEGILFDISGKRDNGIRFIITSLVILGLLGTFMGMTIALFKASGIIGMIKTPGSEGSTEGAFRKLLEELAPVLGGMRMAFTTSVMGLSLSIVLGTAFATYSSSRASYRIEATAFANEKLLPIFTSETELDLGGALQKFSSRVTETVGEFSNTVTESLERTEDNSRKTLQEMRGELEQFFRGISEQLVGFADDSRRAIRELVDGISDQNNVLIEKVTHSTKEVVDRVGGQNEVLIEKVTNSTKELIESSLSAFREEFKSLYQEVVDNRAKIDLKLQRFLDEATEATTSVSAENRTLIEQIRDQLAADLDRINNTLIEQLSDLTQRLNTFDVPVQRAAENIEGTQENFVRFMRETIGDLQREFQRQNENNKQQLDALIQANRRIDSLVTQLAENSKIQSDEVSKLTKDITSLTSNVESLSSNAGLLGRSVSGVDQHLEALGASIRDFAEKSTAHQAAADFGSLNRSISTIALHVQTLSGAANKLAEQTKYRSFPETNRRKFLFFWRRPR